ncbi:MAG: cell division protein FtsL [Gammaproteobacteria bacterium]|nr:cell division protein FtsL [Gammaproteobacteria bacterium]NIR82270.1 cell division protein FtsL [Gammaproteobacteria bacterium]NIR91201.1 cell division protein FtsL [Gammaproteobacteria bacterium]NIU03419.1 cell division protein FtsL [Gammaproteobacteria bacterium]NIX84694.1 cell division protein FtsL [Gammaproteobacteria bacterium]
MKGERSRRRTRGAAPVTDNPRGVRYGVAVLAAAVFVSALAVVYVKHRGRVLFVQLQTLERERDAMQVERGQLQLEESTWATHDRIERVARERLGLVIPSSEETVLVRSR